MSLEDARKSIDRIDRAIVSLLDERARVGREIARHKVALGLPFRNPEREEQVLFKLRELSDGSMPAAALVNIYRAIMGETLALQEAGSSGTPVAKQSPVAGDWEQPAHVKKDFTAVVVENSRAAPGFHRMRLRAAAFAGLFRPGQFFQLRPAQGRDSLFLRRPFAPCAVQGDEMTFYYAVVGTGTSRMATLRTGEVVQVLAPLGNSYHLPPAGSRALLVGGGFGAPSLAPLAAALKAAGMSSVVLLGARTREAVLEQHAFAGLTDRLLIATDDGSHGCKGTVIDAFRQERDIGSFDHVYACGPLPMLRAAALLAEELGCRCQVSLEERMACGFGACMGCAVPVLQEGASIYKRVCHDGPVFDAGTLAWHEMKTAAGTACRCDEEKA